MKYYVTCSTGKDSEATIWWAYHNLSFNEWEVIFNDVDWDSQEVFDHLSYLESRIGKKFIIVKNKGWRDEISESDYNAIIEIFGGPNIFAELAVYKGRFSSTKARICTQKLKVEPCIDFILDTIHEDCTIIQGVRAEESPSRAAMKESDDYFKFYFEPYGTDKNGKPQFHSYRKQDVISHCDKYTVNVFRPILKKSAADVFSIIFENDSPGNALYRQGQARVGCYPCIMCKLGEIRLIAINSPERIEQLEQLERLSGSTFFPPGFIPVRFCTKMALCKLYRGDLIKVMTKKPKASIKGQDILFSNTALNLEESLYQQYFKNPLIEVFIDEDGDEYILRRVKVPTIKDVVKYVIDNPNQQEAFPASSGCVSFYNICETNNN